MTSEEFRRLLFDYGDACRAWVVSGSGAVAMDEAAAKVEAALAAAEERARRAEQALEEIAQQCASLSITHRASIVVSGDFKSIAVAARLALAPPPAATETPEGASHE